MLKQQVYKEGNEDVDTCFLKMLLHDIIASQKDSQLERDEQLSTNINTIYTVVASNYYENSEDLIDFIFKPTPEEKEAIFNWLNKKERYNLLNMLLDEEYENMLELESIEQDDYLTKGPITFEREKEKMDRIRESISEDLPEEIQELLNTLMATQDEENVHIKIDAENAFLIEHPHCIFEEYPYVLGSDLADKTLEKTATYPIIIYTMLSITETLTKETYQSVQSKLGFREEASTKRRKTKRKQNKNEN